MKFYLVFGLSLSFLFCNWHFEKICRLLFAYVELTDVMTCLISPLTLDLFTLVWL